MNRLLFWLLLCGLMPLCGQAQTVETIEVDEFGDKMNQVFINLDMTEATTGFLYDRSGHFARLPYFNGVDTFRDNRCNMESFGAIYATLFSANFDPALQLPAPDSYMVPVGQTAPDSDTIPFAVLSWKYNILDSNALVLGLLRNG